MPDVRSGLYGHSCPGSDWYLFDLQMHPIFDDEHNKVDHHHDMVPAHPVLQLCAWVNQCVLPAS